MGVSSVEQAIPEEAVELAGRENVGGPGKFPQRDGPPGMGWVV